MASRAIMGRRAASLALAGCLASGCLLKRVDDTWYLDPRTGEVTWTVLERDVRSDAKTPAERLTEEREYWTAVQANGHPAALGLREFGAAEVRTRILRDRPPYSVVTEAALPTIDEVGRRLISLCGLAGTSVLAREGDTLRWTLTMGDAPAEASEMSEGTSTLAGAFDTLRVVLTDGAFASATGFTLDADHRVARVNDLGDDNDHRPLVLELGWTAVPTGGGR